MGELIFSGVKEIASKERLHKWYSFQSKANQPLYYILPSGNWFQSARTLQPGISYQTFDDLALCVLKTAKLEFTAITENDRFLLFYEILTSSQEDPTEKELVQKAKAYSDSYGQLKRLGLKVEETPQSLEVLKEAFSIYEEHYRDNQGLLDPENRILKAVETTDLDFPISHVVIDGYMDFSPIQFLFIDYLVKAGISFTIYLPALDTPLIHETVSALKKIGVQIPSEKLAPQKVMCQGSTVTRATTIEEEIYGVLETIEQIKGLESYSLFGIVLASETAYLDELERISEERQIPLKRAKKKRLEETSFLSFLNQILIKPESKTKWDQLPLVDTLAKLCFSTPIEFNGLKDSFIQTGDLGSEQLASLLDETVLFQEKLREKASMSFYMKQTLNFLESSPLPVIWKKLIKARIPGRMSQVALEMRAFQHALKWVKNALELQPISGVEVKLETFRSQLLNRLSEESLYIDRKQADGIEIYSLRDVPLFKGKHLFVLGLNEGQFPKQVNLKGYFQERYVENIVKPYPLPLSDYFRKKDDAAFAQLKYIAENISFSYVEGINPHQPLLPSKYLMEMTDQTTSFGAIARLESHTYLTLNEYEEKLAYHAGTGKDLKDTPSQLMEYKNILDRLQTGEERISSKWADILASNRTSITKLESYASCSFKFGLERVLKIQDPLEKQRMIDPIETGNMLHRIIEAFYKETLGKSFSTLSSFFQKEDEGKLAAIFEKEWVVIEQKHHEIPKITLDKSKEDWWKKLKKWLAAERFRFWENEALADMSIFKMEETIELNIELENQGVLTLTGKIDRIDIDDQGFVIYDYKSSDKDLDFEKEVPAGLMLQIPLYMMALENKFSRVYPIHQNKVSIGGGYISIKNPHLRKKNMVWRDEEQRLRFEPNKKIKTHIVPVDSESLKTNYNLPDLIEALWRGTFTDFSVRPFSRNSCKYCSFKAICRVTREQQEALKKEGNHGV